MIRGLIIMTLLAASFPWEAGAAADAIEKNPFTRPGYTADRPLPTNMEQQREELEPLELKATLIAGRRALANLSGEILAPGDEFRGYRLLRVSEGRAVLIRDGQTTTLEVRDDAKKEEARE